MKYNATLFVRKPLRMVQCRLNTTSILMLYSYLLTYLLTYLHTYSMEQGPS